MRPIRCLTRPVTPLKAKRKPTMTQVNRTPIATPTSGCQCGNLRRRREPRVGLRGGRNREYTLAEKLAARLIVAGPDECWLIQGHALPYGHVKLSIGSPWRQPYIRKYAHVFAWEQANGRTVPEGLEVMHACDEGRCCNPAHLSIGTHLENMRDSVRKGRLSAWRKTGIRLNGQPARRRSA
jgi:hypothetical protein